VVGLFGVSAAFAAGLGGGSSAVNRASAQAEAMRLLALVRLPAGVRASAVEPAADQHVLREPTYDEATPNLVDAHAWWTTSSSPAAVLAYVRAHLPHGVVGEGSSASGGPPGTVLASSESFVLSGIPGTLAERVIGITFAALADGETAIRTDGEAVWITPRPAWERIPAGVERATFTASGASGNGVLGPPSASRTLTGAALHKLVSAINQAEVVQPGVRGCPLGITESVSLQFFNATGRMLARATENPTGCASVSVAIGSRSGPPLDDYPSVTDELIRVGAVPECATGQLSASVTPPGRDGPPNAQIVSFSFTNRSDVMCRLAGFPRLGLFDSAGRRLPIAVSDDGAAIVRRQGIGADSVLDPEQSAGFGVTYIRCRGARVAVRATVTLPGLARRFTLPLGSPAKPVAPCHSAVGVGNVVEIL
jgi:hypothetical protein